MFRHSRMDFTYISDAQGSGGCCGAQDGFTCGPHLNDPAPSPCLGGETRCFVAHSDEERENSGLQETRGACWGPTLGGGTSQGMARGKQQSLGLDPGMVEDEEETSQVEGSKGPSGAGGQAGMRAGGREGRGVV